MSFRTKWRVRKKKTVQEYEETIEQFAKAGATSEDEFFKWTGYRPKEGQKILILAACKRELWKE